MKLTVVSLRLDDVIENKIGKYKFYLLNHFLVKIRSIILRGKPIKNYHKETIFLKNSVKRSYMFI